MNLRRTFDRLRQSCSTQRHSRRRRTCSYRSETEALESRLLLSGSGLVTIDIDDGNFLIRGTSGDEHIAIETMGGGRSVFVTALDENTSIGHSGSSIAIVDASRVTGDWDIDLGGGDNLVRMTGDPLTGS